LQTSLRAPRVSRCDVVIISVGLSCLSSVCQTQSYRSRQTDNGQRYVHLVRLFVVSVRGVHPVGTKRDGSWKF